MALILDDIMLSPLKLTVWLGKKLTETAQAEMTDESKVYEELLNLQMRYEVGEIGEDAYEKQETRLMERLASIRKMKEDM